MSTEETTLSEWWTPEREKCLEMVYAGASVKQIAENLGQHRNTITNWKKHPEFQARLAELHGDRLEAMRARRAQQTNNFADRFARLTDKALEKAEDAVRAGHTVPPAVRQEIREWAAEFRTFREQERVDSGDNVQRHQHAVFGQVQHQHSIRGESFRDYAQKALTENIIDADAIESEAEPVIALVERVLADTDVIDVMDEEDRAEKARQLAAENEL